MGEFHADLGGRNPGHTDAAMRCPGKSDSNHTIHVPIGTWLGFLPLHCEAAGNTLKCRLRLDPEKSIHWGDKLSEGTTLFEAGVKALILILLISNLQAILGGFGMVVGGVSIHYTHIIFLNVFNYQSTYPWELCKSHIHGSDMIWESFYELVAV